MLSRSSDSASFMPAAGSSSSRYRGLRARARAISSRRCNPYARVPAGRCVWSAIRSSTRSPCARASMVRGSPRFPLAARAALTFSRQVRFPNSLTFWNVRPTRLRAIMCAGAAVMSTPSSRTEPSVMSSAPDIQPSSVVFPEPFGPNQPDDLAGPERYRGAVDCSQSVKVLDHSGGFENACSVDPRRWRHRLVPKGQLW